MADSRKHVDRPFSFIFSLRLLSTRTEIAGTAEKGERERKGANKGKDPGGSSLSVPPSSDFQVAGSDAIRLPTLKELIGYRSNDFASSPSPVYLSLLDRDTNLVLEADAVPGSSFSNASEVSALADFASDREPWKLDQSERGSYTVKEKEDELDLLGGKTQEYYVQENIADEEEEGSSGNRKRIDREDSTTTTLRPTTWRGVPLVDFFQSQIQRGFYVTKSESEALAARKINSDEIATVLPIEEDENTSDKIERLSLPDAGVNAEDTFDVETSTRTSTEPTTTSSLKTDTEEPTTYTDATSMDNGEEKSSKTTTQQLRRRTIWRNTDSTTIPTIADYQSTPVVRNKGRSRSRNRVGSTTPSADEEQTQTETLLAETGATSSTILTTLEPSLLASSKRTTIESKTVPGSPSLPTSSIPTETSTVATTFVSYTDSKSSFTSEPVSELSASSAVLESDDSATGKPSITDPVAATIANPSESLIEVTNSDTLESATISSSTTNADSVSSATSLNTSKVQSILDFETSNKPSSTETTTTVSLEHVTGTELNARRDPDPGSKKTDQDSTTLASITTPPSTTVKQSTKTPVSRTNRRRQKISLDSVQEFGQRANRRRGRPTVEDEKDSSKETKGAQQPRRRVHVYRGRRRRPTASPAVNDSAVPDRGNPKVTTVETNGNSTVKNPNDRETSDGREAVSGKELEPNEIETKVREERRRVEENVDRAKPEVNSSKTTVTSSRTPGSLPATRLRKPTALSSTSSQNKPPNTLVNNRKNRPTDGNEKVDATETPKREKDSDQSSRAQEIAVTLADPPSPQASTTGRPSFKNALRRRISTTLAPRTDSTTSRTTLGFAPTPRDRQRPRTKDRPQQNATTRPRRPQVIDYDYYEDEEEPVVGKSTYKGKLFLTNKGTIRCLDQGNFPHPYSCRKFITCAKMVNGLVVGAEYTCPDKLSYDPVGGICNWSAGLGCKE